MVDEIAIVRKFMVEEMQLTPDALEALRALPDADTVVDKVLASIRTMEKKPIVLTKEELAKFLGVVAVAPPAPTAEQVKSSPEIKRELPEVRPPERLTELARLRFRPFAAEIESDVKVLRDITGRSHTEGGVKDFVKLFKNRYEKLRNILRMRVELQGAVPIKSALSYDDGEIIKLIGMVANIRKSKAGNEIIELEDEGGRAVIIVSRWKRELAQKMSEVVKDEVVGIIAAVRKGDRAPLLLADDIIWPDIPAQREPARAVDNVCAALISDLHVGSEMFLEDAFTRFLKWLRGEVGKEEQRELAGRVKYVVIAGDLVDGIGIYPAQEEELLITDIFKQYDAATELLAQIPEHIKIVIAPGNHDAVRSLEPQPAIPKDVAPVLHSLNTVMVGNPTWLNIHGVKFLVYHGRSFDDLVSNIPGLNRQKIIPFMTKLLQKRHLAPIYGERTQISPEQMDYLVIDDVPDIFHCGHMHVYGCEKYRGVTLVNSGTFQERTTYMTSMGIEPTPGRVPIVDLQTHQTRVIHFV